MCFHLGTNFHSCPSTPLSLTRRGRELTLEEYNAPVKKVSFANLVTRQGAETSRKLPSCSLCSCTEGSCSLTSGCIRCDADDHCPCDHDDDDCDEDRCDREDEGGTTDDVTSLLVDCTYLYGDRTEGEQVTTCCVNT